jgi:hypothetical protein
MRSPARNVAHVLERLGLALAGAAGGLFVAAHAGSGMVPLTPEVFLFAMMIAGAAGFYLGIDEPPHRFLGVEAGLPRGWWSAGRIDATELLSAVGTFLVTLTAFVSVVLIVFGKETHLGWTMAIMAGWIAGVVMQVAAGVMARMRM